MGFWTNVHGQIKVSCTKKVTRDDLRHFLREVFGGYENQLEYLVSTMKTYEDAGEVWSAEESIEHLKSKGLTLEEDDWMIQTIERQKRLQKCEEEENKFIGKEGAISIGGQKLIVHIENFSFENYGGESVEELCNIVYRLLHNKAIKVYEVTLFVDSGISEYLIRWDKYDAQNIQIIPLRNPHNCIKISRFVKDGKMDTNAVWDYVFNQANMFNKSKRR